jgi:hypothetical protein
MTRFRAQKEASRLRGDVAALADELAVLYKKKLMLIEHLRGNSAALRSFLLSGDDASVDDLCASDAFIITEADGLDADIGRLKDELSRVTGLNAGDVLQRIVYPSAAGKEIAELRRTINSILLETQREREAITREMETKSASLKLTADELEAMSRLREYTPSGEPLL